MKCIFISSKFPASATIKIFILIVQHCSWKHSSCEIVLIIEMLWTHWGLVTSNSDIDLVNIGSGIGLFAWRHQAITWTHVDLSTTRPIYIYLSHPSLDSSAPGQNCHLFADDIFRCIFVNEKFRILIKISLKFIAKGQIDNNPALV